MTVTMGPHATSLKALCPDLHEVLGEEIVSLIDRHDEHNDDDDNNDNATAKAEHVQDVSYWDQVHLMFIFRVLVARTNSELAIMTLSRHHNHQEEAPSGTTTASKSSLLVERLQLFKAILSTLEHGLEQSTTNVGRIVVQFAKAYNLTKLQLRVVQLLVTVKAQPSPSLLELLVQRDGGLSQLIFCSPGDEQMALEHTPVRYICGATTLEWSVLANENFALCVDHILVFADETYGDNRLSISDEACRALMGMELTAEDKLKLSGTKLLRMVGGGEEVVKTSIDHNKSASNVNNTDQAAINSMLKTLNVGGDAMSDEGDPTDIAVVEKDSAAAEEEAFGKGDDGDEDSGELIDMMHLMTETEASSDEAVDPTQPRSYSSELEYLKDMFEMVMHKVIYSRQRQAQDLRKASITDNKKPSWMSNDTASKKSTGEISAKIKMIRHKIEISLELTRNEGVFFPRLELLVSQLHLNDFEKFVLVYLVGSMISPIFKSCIKTDQYRRENVLVGELLSAYYESFADEVAGRTAFYKSSRLVKKGLVRLVEAYAAVADLTDQEVLLDRRVLDCIVGLDNESTQITRGSHLYDPKVKLEAVVLPEKMKDTITSAVTHFDQFRKYRRDNPQFDENISYGVGLTLMFCGQSGTGKTMTANAIAAKLGKKLLLVNFPLLSKGNGNSNEESSSRYQAIFREAELSDAIIFFDECESLFSKRGAGGSTDTTELLTELERYEGIVFLATNRPYDLDEAMYRRISEVFEFKAPNYMERLDIWKLVTSPKSIPCDPKIDWEAIALQYELTGGFIKNAVMSSLLDAVGRDPQNPLITQRDIVEGCKKQVRGALQMVEFTERVIPRAGLDELVTTDAILDKLWQMVRLEKARGILFGSWGFDNDMRSRQGTTALFWGPSGTGRSRAAEAIGFELGKPLKVVDLPRLLEQKSNSDSYRSSSAASSIRSIFKEARLQDAVLVLDGFALNTESSGGNHHGGDDSSRSLNLVIREMTRFPGVVIMNVDTEGSLDVFVSRLDKGLVGGLKFLVEFQVPAYNNRCRLWKKLMPLSVPLAEEIRYNSLAEASNDFSQAQIGNAIYRAAANAAIRSDASKRCVSMKDLFDAIEDEKRRGESSVDRWVKAQYI